MNNGPGLEFCAEKQFQLAIISLAGAGIAWALIFDSFFGIGNFRAPSWFIFASGTLSMVHVGLFCAYLRYGRLTRDSTDPLEDCFIFTAFAVPFFASYYVPWYIWWRGDLYKFEYKPFLFLLVVGVVNWIFLKNCRKCNYRSLFLLRYDAFIVIFIGIFVGFILAKMPSTMLELWIKSQAFLRL